MNFKPAWVVAVAAALVSVSVAAQEIKISHQFKANADARDLATRVFVKEVNARDPNLKFRIYPAQSLGIKPVAQLDALQNGTLEMAVFPMSYAVGKAQEFSIIIMPGTVPTLEHAMKLRGTPFQKKLQDLAHANGIHIVTWWWTPGAFATKDREITGPKSVAGLKLRAADPTFETMLKAAGASVANMPSTEIYPSLQSGVLNGTLTSAETFVSMRLYEQTKMATLPGKYSLWMLLQPLVMSKQHWDKLSPGTAEDLRGCGGQVRRVLPGTSAGSRQRHGEGVQEGRRQGPRDDPGRIRRVGDTREGNGVEGIRRPVGYRKGTARHAARREVTTAV
jgi:TRAP-type transport system periplasmic protein